MAQLLDACGLWNPHYQYSHPKPHLLKGQLLTLKPTCRYISRHSIFLRISNQRTKFAATVLKTLRQPITIVEKVLFTKKDKSKHDSKTLLIGPVQTVKMELNQSLLLKPSVRAHLSHNIF